MLRPGFEPGSRARKARMIGRTTPPELISDFNMVGPKGFEPLTTRL